MLARLCLTADPMSLLAIPFTVGLELFNDTVPQPFGPCFGAETDVCECILFGLRTQQRQTYAV